MKNLIALAKSNAYGVNCASAGIGRAAHFARQRFSRTAGVAITHVRYQCGVSDFGNWGRRE
ncbi:MAG: hypothetical protein HYU73_09145 [Betaproteobacteria bacterium]|nr:hypothetical protein [Betaproteobacteria bacterium]MBI3054415.1 hypothetical protein [Betaproteobacteria bacterium]